MMRTTRTRQVWEGTEVLAESADTVGAALPAWDTSFPQSEPPFAGLESHPVGYREAHHEHHHTHHEDAQAHLANLCQTV